MPGTPFIPYVAGEEEAIEFTYDNALFAFSSNGLSSEWTPDLTRSRSRWLFIGTSPMTLAIESDTPVDLNRHHVPWEVQVEGSAYTWNDVQVVEFMLEPDVDLDPGVSVTRSTDTEKLNPGYNDVHITATVSFLKNPVIEDQEYPITWCWIGIEEPVWPGLTFNFIGDSWFSFDVDVGDIVTVETDVEVYNPYSSQIVFMPTVDVSLYMEERLYSQNYAQSQGDLIFDVTGPLGEELAITASSEDGQSWEARPVHYHGDIWLWWEGHLITVEEGNRNGQRYPPSFLKGNQISVIGDDLELPVDEACYVVHGYGTGDWKQFEEKKGAYFFKELWFELYIDDVPVNLKNVKHHYKVLNGIENQMLNLWYIQFKLHHFEAGETYRFRGEWWDPEGLMYTSERYVTFTDT